MIHVFAADAKAIAACARARGLEAIACETLPELEVELPALEVLLAARLPVVDWRVAERLRLVQTMGAGVDEILLQEPPPAHVPLATAKGEFAPEVAEYVVGALLAFARGFPQLVQRQHAREWVPFACGTLRGRRACLVGAGEIGSRVARTLDSLGVHVDAIVARPRPLPHVDRVVGPERRLEVLAGADMLVAAAPLTIETRGLIGAHELALLARDAVVVDVSRAGVILHDQLLGALEQGALGGAVIDVFAEEPLPDESPWWSAPNTWVTPHLAGLGRDYAGRCVDRLIVNLARLDAGEPLLGLADLDRGY